MYFVLSTSLIIKRKAVDSLLGLFDKGLKIQSLKSRYIIIIIFPSSLKSI